PAVGGSALPRAPGTRYADRHRALPALAGAAVLEDSPSPVYGAALLMRFGSDPIRGSNPRASALRQGPLPGGSTDPAEALWHVLSHGRVRPAGTWPLSSPPPGQCAS